MRTISINRELSEAQHPYLMSKVLRTKFRQGHTLNGCCGKLASNLNAKVGLFILADPRQCKNVFLNFHNFDFLSPLKNNIVYVIYFMIDYV